MIREKTLEMPELDIELIRLLYHSLDRGESSLPRVELLSEELRPNSILFHADSDRTWAIGNVSYEGGLSGIISNNYNGHFGYTLYDGRNEVGSVSGIENPHGVLIVKEEQTDPLVEMHLGSLSLLVDRYEYMRRLNPLCRDFDELRKNSPYWRLVDESKRNDLADTFLREVVEKGIANRAKMLYDGLKSDTSFKILTGKPTKLRLFTEDAETIDKEFNPILVNIAYSPELAQKIKRSLK
jgi:hypothetical protein